MAKKTRHLAGVYSGQAADGMDAAVIRATGRGIRLGCEVLHHVHMPFAEPLRRRLREAQGGACGTPRDLAELDRSLAGAFAEAASVAIERAGLAPEAVQAIGSGGQVIYAAPGGRPGAQGVLELASPAVIAERTALPVAAGFARAARAAGDRGGRVAGWADWALLSDKRLSRVAVHLGGLATVTFLPAGGLGADTMVFDAGPGTMVLDALCRRDGREYDDGGARAARGTPCPTLLNELLSAKFFQQGVPRHTTAAEWDDVYLQRLDALAARHRCGGDDLLATATELSARAVAAAVGELTERPHQVILSGGGAANIHLAGRIRRLLSPSSTVTSEKFGLPLRAKQAVCVALLAAATVDKLTARFRANTADPAPTAAGTLALPPARPIE